MNLRLIAASISLCLCSVITSCHMMAPDDPGYDMYTCNDDFEFTITNAQDGSFVIIGIDNSRVHLPRVVAASGAKYSDGDLTYWYHQGEANILEGDTITHRGCTIRY